VQSANDTNAQDDRNYLDLEFQQLKAEINRVTQNTQWNGMNILDQTEPASGAREGTFTFQVGANTGDSHKITHKLDKLAFGASAGAATFAAPAIAAGVQTSAVTLDDAFKEGEVITLTVANRQVQYTVTKEDAAATPVGAAVATGLAKSFGASPAIAAVAAVVADPNATPPVAAVAAVAAKDAVDGEFNGLKVTISGAVISFVGAKDQTFDAFSKTTDGKLASVDALTITSQSNSDVAIGGLDAALTKVNEARAEIGAVINRLNYAVDNMTNVSMNTSESRSRILDTDYAKASAELARTQIISQAATAMLAQANQQPQAVLQLLQG
jgi:flagellin